MLIVSDPESACRRGEVEAIVARTRDAESLAKAAGAAGEFGKVARTAHLDVSRPSHGLDSRQRLQCAEQDASRLTLRLAGNIQAIMVPVDKVDVGVTRRSEQYGIAQGAAGGGVSRRIVDAKVSFDLNDARY